jgi:hypothetical protein
VRLSDQYRAFFAGAILVLVPLLVVALFLGAGPLSSRLVAHGPVATKTPQNLQTPTPSVEPTPTPTDQPVAPAGKKATSAEFAGFFAPDFAGKTSCKFSHQLVAIAGSTMTVTYAKGSSAPSAGAPYGGAQLCVPFAGGSAADVTISYDVRFPVGFQWVKGGKLPGVYGGKQPFSGGKHNPNGWSMRLMWRENGTAEVYGYITNSTGYGDDWTGGGLAFQADGQWHHLAEHIHVNSPGGSDGYVTLSYDGTVYINKTGLAITSTNTPVSGLYFSTFYGGHDATWSPSADMHIDYRNFHRS